MNILKSFWAWLDGKKRGIALIYWTVVMPAMQVIWPNGFPEGFATNLNKSVIIFGLLLTTLGFGHAYAKSRAAVNSTDETLVDVLEEKPEEQKPSA